jgi:hypothetical protein
MVLKIVRDCKTVTTKNTFTKNESPACSNVLNYILPCPADVWQNGGIVPPLLTLPVHGD